MEPTPLPVKRLLVLCTILITESFCLTMLFPYVPFMVRDFHLTDDDSAVGFYSGFVASAFCVAQFISSFFWGRLSDRFGRRPILLIGLGGTFVSVILFGFSPWYWWALGSRALAGLLNGNVGVAKTYLGEITDKSNQAKGFSVFGLTWGLASILGPLVGGLLSNPASKYPAVFGGTIFEQFPYLLPPMVSASVTLMGFIFGFCFLTESKRTPSEPPASIAMVPRKTSSMKEGQAQDEQPMLDQQVVDEEAALSTKDNISEEEEIESKSSPQYSGRCSGCHRLRHKIRTSVAWQLLSNRSSLVPTALYGLMALTFIAIDEVFPLWAMSERSVGGLKMDSSQIGLAMAAGGATLIVLQLLVYHRLERRFGSVILFRMGLFGAMVIFPIYPMIHWLDGQSPVLIMAAVMGCHVMRYVSSILSFTSIMIMINESAPDHRGAVNGIGQSFASLARALGPSAAGMLFSWSITNTSFPINFWFMFLLVSLFSAFTAAVSWSMPKQRPYAVMVDSENSNPIVESVEA